MQSFYFVCLNTSTLTEKEMLLLSRLLSTPTPTSGVHGFYSIIPYKISTIIHNN